MSCKAPRCYKSNTTNACTIPNPWVVFQRTVKGKDLSKEEKSKAYAKFLSQFQTIRATGDEKAYRAALCLSRRSQPLTKPKKHSIIAKFVERLMKERREIEMGCDMPPNLKEFFQQFVPTEIVGAPMNACQLIAKFMLEQCVPRNERKYYTFQNKISSGAHGLLLSGTYKQKPVAIKIIPVHKRIPYALSFQVDHEPQKIKSVSEKNILREVEIQKHVGNMAFKKFLVPKILGNVGFLSSKKDKQHRVAVLVMEKVVDPIHLEKASAKEQTKRVAQTPIFITELQKKGVVHGDLHIWNVLFTKDKPYVIDYGRSVILDKFKNGTKEDAAMLSIMDYIIPMEMVLRGVNHFNAPTIGKMVSEYLKTMQKPAIKAHVEALLKKISNHNFKSRVDAVLMPLPAGDAPLVVLQEYYDDINALRLNYFYSKNRDWARVLDI